MSRSKLIYLTLLVLCTLGFSLSANAQRAALSVNVGDALLLVLSAQVRLMPYLVIGRWKHPGDGILGLFIRDKTTNGSFAIRPTPLAQDGGPGTSFQAGMLLPRLNTRNTRLVAYFAARLPKAMPGEPVWV
jgi:hypothetical protein